MIVFLNNEFVPAERALVSAFDRGFLYGDGLFETVRVANGRLVCWDEHLERLRRGAGCLKIAPGAPLEQWRGVAAELIRRNQLAEGVVRMVVSRGPGARGYSPRDARTPTVVLSAHPLPPMTPASPPSWRLMTASVRLPPAGPLAAFKTCNKLPQIMARAEADAAQADEALLPAADGSLVTGSASNLFWIEQAGLCTAPESSGILPGITRAQVLELCRQHGIPCREVSANRARLVDADGVFLTQSSVGIAEAVSLDGAPLKRSPLAARIGAALAERMAQRAV